MNITKLIPSLLGIFTILFSAAAYAAPDIAETPKESKTPSVDAAKKLELKAERKDGKVTLTWTRPDGEWRGVDILRNSKADSKGRKKLKSLSSSATRYVDQLSDAGTPYWYWLKFTGKDGKTLNIGPTQVK